MQREERIVVTSEEQRRVDELAVREGVTEAGLVRSAGRSAAEWILERARPRDAVVLAGPGGNGADALVTARWLGGAGVDVQAFLLAPGEPGLGSLKTARDDWLAAGGRVVRVEGPGLGELERALAQADLVVDGLYGSGLTRPLGGLAAEVVERANAANARIVSLDVPSGVAADRGDVPGPAIRARATLAMEFLKPAHLLFPAAELCGDVEVVAVAYPDSARSSVAPWARVLERHGAARRLPHRPPSGHKGTFGHVLLVAGSAGMVGAAILAGRAALRAGAGLLTIAIPSSQAAAVHASLPEALVVPLPEEAGHIVPAAVADLAAAFARADVLAIGPGLSRAGSTSDAAAEVLATFEGPVVADADALYAAARRTRMLETLRGRAILTPHPGELSLLTGGDATTIDRNRVAAAREFAAAHGAITVLKGRPTAIALLSGSLYLNPTGNTGLATGGSGDVLTGILAGLAASGASLEDAALVGPYVHGLAADLFAERNSERSLLPSDVVDLLPRAFQEIERCA